MTAKDLKELQKVIQLCQKSGVTHIKLEGLELQLGSLPTKLKKHKPFQHEASPEENIPVPQFVPMPVKQVAETIATDELSEEQLMFYSARPETPVEDRQA